MGGGGGGRNRRLEELQAETLEDEIRRRDELEADLEARRRLRQLGGRRGQLRFFGPRPIQSTPNRRIAATTRVVPTGPTSAQREVAAGNERGRGDAGRGGTGSAASDVAADVAGGVGDVF